MKPATIPNGSTTVKINDNARVTLEVQCDKLMGFNVVYTASTFPAVLDSDTDIKAHDALAATGKLGLVNPGGTVCCIVEFAPGFDCMMHRTQSLD
jgi:hypothetical protein